MTVETAQTPAEQAAEWAAVAAERETPPGSTPAVVEEPVVVAADPAPAEVVADDPYAALSPEVKKKLEQLDSLLAAVPTLAQGLQEAKGRIGSLQSELAKSRQAAPTQEKVAAATVDPAKWAALKADFPEWGEGIEARIQQGLQSVAGQGLTADQMNAEILKASEAIRKETQEDLVESVHPNWRQDINTDAFGAWYAVQPDDVKALATSPKGRDAVRMLNLYQKSQETPVADVKASRKAALAAAAQAKPGSAVVTKTFEDMTEKEQWDFMAAERARRDAAA